jgi:hypothetical protein
MNRFRGQRGTAEMARLLQDALNDDGNREYNSLTEDQKRLMAASQQHPQLMSLRPNNVRRIITAPLTKNAKTKMLAELKYAQHVSAKASKAYNEGYYNKVPTMGNPTMKGLPAEVFPTSVPSSDQAGSGLLQRDKYRPRSSQTVNIDDYFASNQSHIPAQKRPPMAGIAARQRQKIRASDQMQDLKKSIEDMAYSELEAASREDPTLAFFESLEQGKSKRTYKNMFKDYDEVDDNYE